MHLGSISKTSFCGFSNPSSKFLQTSSPPAHSDIRTQALLAGLLTNCYVLVANVGGILNLTKLIEENLRQKQRKKKFCLGHIYSVQAGANNLFSLCLWSLPRNRSWILLFACVTFLIIVSSFNPPQTKPSFYCVCTYLKVSNTDCGYQLLLQQILTTARSCRTEHISLLCFLHSSSTTWHQTWLLLWQIKCYFMDRWLSRSWMTLQSSDSRSREGFAVHQTISGSGMSQAFRCWSLGQVLEKYQPCSGFLMTLLLPSSKLYNYIWSDYKSNKLSLTCYDYTSNYNLITIYYSTIILWL